MTRWQLRHPQHPFTHFYGLLVASLLHESLLPSPLSAALFLMETFKKNIHTLTPNWCNLLCFGHLWWSVLSTTSNPRFVSCCFQFNSRKNVCTVPVCTVLWSMHRGKPLKSYILESGLWKNTFRQPQNIWTTLLCGITWEFCNHHDLLLFPWF